MVAKICSTNAKYVAKQERFLSYRSNVISPHFRLWSLQKVSGQVLEGEVAIVQLVIDIQYEAVKSGRVDEGHLLHARAQCIPRALLLTARDCRVFSLQTLFLDVH
jgi:hypothetical protein